MSSNLAFIINKSDGIASMTPLLVLLVLLVTWPRTEARNKGDISLVSLGTAAIFLEITSCVELGKLINISLNQFPHQLNMDNKKPDLVGVVLNIYNND